jgi:predicted small lipoprotein YifL
MSLRLLRPLALLLLVVALAAPLAACGKKGPPIPPDGQDSDYPRTYPTR